LSKAKPLAKDYFWHLMPIEWQLFSDDVGKMWDELAKTCFRYQMDQGISQNISTVIAGMVP
jgi:hypothetical protein